MQVKDLMSKDVFVLYAGDNLLLAEEIMQWKRIRHVPVVDQRYNLKGLVTHRDMLRASISTLAQLSGSESRNPSPYFVARYHANAGLYYQS
jgi:CBS-domain-containing membrane protein